MSAHLRPNMVDAKDGPVDLGMLVGALVRAGNVGTVGKRPDHYESAVRAAEKLGYRPRSWVLRELLDR